jgi:FtsP/CotA-like multicopper oxidase with cupredoxin domain
VTASAHHLYASQVDFSSDQPQEGSPSTEFRQRPDRSMTLDFFNDRMRFDDGAEHDIWSFENDRSGRALPAPLVRVTEGQVFHGTIKPSKRTHTIHWHGMEPDPRNDGVGHTSFEVSGSYTYQWKPETGEPGNPNCGAAGTYFYHCHVNTVLHAQMGMFGPLVIDPVTHPAFPVLPGLTRRAFVDGPEYDIDTETLLVPYSVDPRWHELNHAAGLSGEDVRLNRFVPKHFYLLGGELARRPNRDGVWGLRRMRANVAGSRYPSGELRRPTLLRIIDGNYFPTAITFTDATGLTPVPMAELLSHDGRPFRDTSNPTGPALPLSGRLRTAKLAFGAAERYDVLLHPPQAGKYLLTLQWEDWITRRVLATRQVEITAS